jgi:hypothetical protein
MFALHAGGREVNESAVMCVYSGFWREVVFFASSSLIIGKRNREGKRKGKENKKHNNKINKSCCFEVSFTPPHSSPSFSSSTSSRLKRRSLYD